jgi:isoquinoline 1-oxidoreductase beta subunit
MTTDLDQARGAVSDFGEPEGGPGGISRRKFMGYLIAGPVLIAGARLASPSAASAAAGVDPTTQLPVDDFDLADLLSITAALTNSLISVSVHPDNTVGFALPRAEVGQGLTTSFSVIIADEMGVQLSQVNTTLREAQSSLLYNQLTGGSNSTHSLYSTVRQAAATARAQLTNAAADVHGGVASDYELRDGIIRGNGVAVEFGTLAEHAAVKKATKIEAELKAESEFTLIGTRVNRVDALEAVTGTKQYAMDIQLPGALPCMLCRPPTINGTVQSVNNMSAIKAMPGVEHVVVVPQVQFIEGGVAVVAQTFGHCIDALQMMDVTWGPGTVEGKTADVVASQLAQAELPTAQGGSGDGVINQVFTFNFRPGDPLETNCALVNVTPNSCEIWAAMKSPIWAQQQIAHYLGMPQDQVVAHVTQGGGSFGRHLFCDAPFEAAIVSAKTGVPIRLMWHRTDNFRHGRVHPMARSRVRATYDTSSGQVTSFNQAHTAVSCDFTQGIGEIFTANVEAIPGVNFSSFSEGVFILTANVPYNFGEVTQELNEIYNYDTFHTSSVRNVYSPDVATATELIADALGAKLGLDPLAFRQKFIRDPRMLAVLNKVAELGGWTTNLPQGVAMGLGIHHEYKGYMAVLAQVDARPQQVNRVIKNGYGGPRVTKMAMVHDCGTPINITGLEAMMMGGAMDGIAQALTYSLHLDPSTGGRFLEGSWDNAYYTRQWNVPEEMIFYVMPANGNPPGGAGEFGVGTSMAAVACAYARATGTMPTTFPVNFNDPLGFAPFPFEPPIPQSPTNGLNYLGRPLKVTPQS